MHGGLVSQGTGAQPAHAVFHPVELKKSKFPELIFFDIVTTHNDHVSYVKHVLGSMYAFFTLFG